MSTDRQAEEGETSTPTPVPVQVVCLEELQSTVDALVQKALEKNSPPIPATPSCTTPGGEWNTSYGKAGYVGNQPLPDDKVSWDDGRPVGTQLNTAHVGV